MEETWSFIKEEGLVDYYQISSTGRVRTVDRQILDKNGISKSVKGRECKITDGKFSIHTVEGKSTTRKVAHYVAKYFVDNPSNYTSIRFINGNTNDCNASNLEWITAMDNPEYNAVESLEGEIWKSIDEYPSYTVSNMGRVKSIGRDVAIKGSTFTVATPSQLLTPTLEERSGYLSVGLSKCGKISTHRVHTLVAKAFIPNPDNLPCVDHIDRNKCNNNVSNLRWVSYKDNSRNADNSSVTVTFPDGTSTVYNSIVTASEATGYAPNSISRHCSRRSKPVNGYTFRWTNQKSKLGSQNKRKGNNFELYVVKRLKAIGYPNVVTARSESKRTDDNKIDIIDLDGKLPVNLQTKYTAAAPNYFAIKEQCSDTSKPFGIVWKKSVAGENSPGTVVIIPEDFFYELIKKAAE